MFLLLSSLLLLVYVHTPYAADLLGNSDFEHPHHINPWSCRDCHASISHTSYHGHSSLKVTNRHHKWSGLTQTINVHGGQSYKCRAYIKLLNMPHGKMYVKVETIVSYTSSGRHHQGVIGRTSYQQAAYDWEEIGGDFTLPSGAHNVKLFIQIEDPSVNYLLDYSSCHNITHDSQWKTKANQRIEKLRKGSLSITSATSSGHIDTHGLTVQIKQTKSKFAFGTAVKASYITDSTHKTYQDFIYNNFEWAVLENALKWRQMEWTKGHPNYAKGIDAVKELIKHGIKVRGHNMFWAGDQHEPNWLTNMSGQQLLQEMHSHVNGMISHSKGTLEHWDVNNEKLHGDFFERQTGNTNITMDMFKWMHALEPNVKLFLNEFSVVSAQLSTTAYKSQGKRFKDSGVPIYGLGVQSHLKSSSQNMDVLKYRLDKIAESGLPIWITELTILDTNENAKAATLDDVMTLYFSHAAVEGILLWGFWDQAVYDQKIALASGNNVTPNAAGRKWQELFHKRFRTNEYHSFNGQTTIHANIFLGEHQLIIKQNGKTLHTETINLNHGGQIATVHLQGTGHNIQVSHVGFG